MSRKRRGKKRKGRVPPHLRKYLFKKKRKSKARRSYKMAKRRRKQSHSRRRSGGHHRRRRRGGGGGRGGWVPPREDLHLYAAAGLVGYAEKMAAGDANNVLNKIPRPVAQLGYTGGTALAAWVVAKLTGNKWARLIARGAAAAAVYQMGRHGGVLADSSSVATTLGDGEYLDMGDDEQLIEDHMMGALDAEGATAIDSMDGIPWEGSVEEADAHV